MERGRPRARLTPNSAELRYSMAPCTAALRVNRYLVSWNYNIQGRREDSPAGQGSLCSPVDAVPEHQDGRVLPGDDGEGVSNGTACRLSSQRVSLIQRLGETVSRAVGSVPVPDRQIYIVSGVANITYLIPAIGVEISSLRSILSLVSI